MSAHNIHVLWYNEVSAIVVLKLYGNFSSSHFPFMHPVFYNQTTHLSHHPPPHSAVNVCRWYFGYFSPQFSFLSLIFVAFLFTLHCCQTTGEIPQQSAVFNYTRRYWNHCSSTVYSGKQTHNDDYVRNEMWSIHRGVFGHIFLSFVAQQTDWLND